MRLTIAELYLLTGALQSFWGSYEEKPGGGWECEEDKTYYTKASKLYQKINKEIKAREEKKKE